MNMTEAGLTNYKLLEDTFGASPNYLLLDPVDEFSVYDGVISSNNKGKHLQTRDTVQNHIIDPTRSYVLIEVKRRSFNFTRFMSLYGGTVIYERKKHEAMQHELSKWNDNAGMWYLSTTSDGFMHCWDTTKMKLNWETRKLRSSTYGDTTPIDKEIAYLNVKDAIVTGYIGQ